MINRRVKVYNLPGTKYVAGHMEIIVETDENYVVEDHVVKVVKLKQDIDILLYKQRKEGREIEVAFRNNLMGAAIDVSTTYRYNGESWETLSTDLDFKTP